MGVLFRDPADHGGDEILSIGQRARPRESRCSVEPAVLASDELREPLPIRARRQLFEVSGRGERIALSEML